MTSLFDKFLVCFRNTEHWLVSGNVVALALNDLFDSFFWVSKADTAYYTIQLKNPQPKVAGFLVGLSIMLTTAYAMWVFYVISYLKFRKRILIGV
ncbi:MAG: hypothetical protein AAB475_00235 [Patescibacteria group bacterium]